VSHRTEKDASKLFKFRNMTKEHSLYRTGYHFIVEGEEDSYKPTTTAATATT